MFTQIPRKQEHAKSVASFGKLGILRRFSAKNAAPFLVPGTLRKFRQKCGIWRRGLGQIFAVNRAAVYFRNLRFEDRMADAQELVYARRVWEGVRGPFDGACEVA